MMAKKKKYDFRLVHHNDFRRHAAKPRRVKLKREEGEGETQKPRKKPKRRLILMKPGARVVAWHRRNPINFIGSLWLMNGGVSCIYRVSHEHLLVTKRWTFNGTPSRTIFEFPTDIHTLYAHTRTHLVNFSFLLSLLRRLYRPTEGGYTYIFFLFLSFVCYEQLIYYTDEVRARSSRFVVYAMTNTFDKLPFSPFHNLYAHIHVIRGSNPASSLL